MLITKLHKQIARYRYDEEGATAVEFAIIAVLFMTFLFGIMETGRVFWTMNTMQYAVEFAGREILLDPDIEPEDLEDAAIEYMAGMRVNTDNFDLVVTNETVDGVEFAVLNGRYDLEIIAPFLPDSMREIALRTDVRVPIIPE